MSKYNLSICAYCKDETDYLEEWINFNRTVGVDHFYIYDNASIIPVKETLSKYIEKNIVTVIDFPSKCGQLNAYSHCIFNYKYFSDWIAFIDCDEFLIPKSSDNIKNILKDYEQYGGLCVNWKFFGSSGFKEKQSGLISETFKSCSDNNHIKTIIKSEFVLSPGSNSHYFKYIDGKNSVSENFELVDSAFSKPSYNKIQLNHYYSKSFEEWSAKVEKTKIGNALPGPPRNIDDIDIFDKDCTDIDTSALQFINDTKKNYLK